MMNNKRWSKILLGLTVLGIVSCSGAKVTTKSSAELSRYDIRTIALVPFTTLTTPQAVTVLDQPIEVPSGVRGEDMRLVVSPNLQQFRQIVTVPISAGETVTQLVWNRLKTRQGITMMLSSQPGKVLTSLAPPHPEVGPVGLSPVVKALKADAILSGQVMIYQERVGSRFGAHPPAVVGFQAKLVAADGELLWESNYYERQRPMTEDFMGFIERHGVFVTADELAIFGVDHMLLEFPFGEALVH